MSLSLVDQYPYQVQMAPVCYLCGAPPRQTQEWPDGEPIIHTGKYIEMEGFLHICGSCWAEGANLLGWRDPAHVARVEVDNAGLRQTVDNLRGEIASLTEANGVLVSGIIERAIPQPVGPATDPGTTRPPVKNAR